jgi:hypothetical protein
MPEISAALGVLGAMITPAVLISACGTLIFSTSTRLALRSVNSEMEFILRLREMYQARQTDSGNHRGEVEGEGPPAVARSAGQVRDD